MSARHPGEVGKYKEVVIHVHRDAAHHGKWVRELRWEKRRRVAPEEESLNTPDDVVGADGLHCEFVGVWGLVGVGVRIVVSPEVGDSIHGAHEHRYEPQGELVEALCGLAARDGGGGRVRVGWQRGGKGEGQARQ